MSLGKIAVIGANQTGLTFAGFAAEKGFVVTVFEAKEKDEVAYDWTDDMAEETFEEIGMPLPPSEVYTRKRCWTFVPPDKKNNIFLKVSDNELDMAIYRRPFNDWLEKRAKSKGAEVEYSTTVKKLIIENNRAVGIEFDNGKLFKADLVVDCGGALSNIRSSLPDEFGIEQRINPNDMFVVKRTFYERPQNTERPEYTNKAYLKHKGEKGISWCLLSYDEKAADVLVGRVGKLEESTFSNAVDDLKKDNEIIGENIIKGGQLLKIPVRHPISCCISNGYALAGDSAYMTIPMLGSGMASGMRSAKLLSDVIANPVGDRFSKANLYRYQQKFMQEIGAKHSAIDLMKNWLLESDDKDVNFLLNKRIVNDNVLKQCSAGQMIKMTIPELAMAGFKGIKNIPLLLKMCKLLIEMNIQYSRAKKMPKVYSAEAFEKWQKRYEKMFNK